jgi:ATP-dependent DNA ligase
VHLLSPTASSSRNLQTRMYTLHRASAIIAGPCAGVPTKRLSELYVALGDLGDVAAKCKGKQPMLAPLPQLTVADVFAQLHRIADLKGAGSAGQKQQAMARMLRACRCATHTSF